MSNKNNYPHTLEDGDARIGGQLQVGDSLVVDDPSGGESLIITSNDGALLINGAGGSSLYPIAGHYQQAPGNNTEIFRFVIASPVDLVVPQGAIAGAAISAVQSTNEYTLSVEKGGTEFATFTFPAGEATAIFDVPEDTTLSTGDVLTIISPLEVDPTLEDITFTLVATG